MWGGSQAGVGVNFSVCVISPAAQPHVNTFCYESGDHGSPQGLQRPRSLQCDLLTMGTYPTALLGAAQGLRTNSDQGWSQVSQYRDRELAVHTHVYPGTHTHTHEIKNHFF